MIFEDGTKVAFRDGKGSFVFQLVKISQGLVIDCLATNNFLMTKISLLKLT